ncbi:hypothetical protein YPPY71_3136, partial [Yersinia pestis PY-71]
PKLKALLNPQPSWGFSGHKKASRLTLTGFLSETAICVELTL